MKMKALSIKPLIIAFFAIAVILAGCKKTNHDPDNQQQDDDIAIVDSAKTIFLAQRDFPNFTGTDGPIIASYDAATGALLNTFKYPHDPAAANYNSWIQYISLSMGNGFLYSIESNKINALNSSTGAVQWAVSIKNNIGAVLHDKTFYGISIDAVMSNVIGSDNNYVYALDATKFTNTYLWKYKVSLAGATTADVQTPIYYRGLVYAMADATHLVALDAGTGALRWTFSFPGNYSHPIIKDGVIYSSVNYNTYYLIDAATGAQKRALTVPDFTGAPSLIGDNSIVYQGGAFDMNGALKWKVNVFGLKPLGLWNGNVVARKDSAYKPSYYAGHLPFLITYALCALNANTGQQKWIRNGYYDSGGGDPLIINNTMYGTTYQRLDAVDLYTGKTKWSISTGSAALGAICIVGASGRSYENSGVIRNEF